MQMISIELPHTSYLRGQTLSGTVHITTESPRTAEEITIDLFRTTKCRCYGYRPSYRFEYEKARTHLVSLKNANIAPSGKLIPFAHKIPEDVPYSFDCGLIKIYWGIEVTTKIGFFPKKKSKKLRILPHLLRSGDISPAGIDLPECKKISIFTALYRPFHAWRYTGFFHESSSLNLYSKEDRYLPGDTVKGGVYFSEGFENADLTVSLVFFIKSKYYRDSVEQEFEAAHAHGVCSTGSSFPFSCRIPETGYPTLRTPHVGIWWKLRAVVERPFRFAKVCEKEIMVDPLVF